MKRSICYSAEKISKNFYLRFFRLNNIEKEIPPVDPGGFPKGAADIIVYLYRVIVHTTSLWAWFLILAKELL